jgi:hypothetical protein
MGEMLSMCCFRCDLCLAWRPNVAHDDRRGELSDAWFEHFGFRIRPEEIACDGCSREPRAKTLDSGCPVRPCVLERGIENCSECSDYPCDRIRERLIDFETLTAGRQVSNRNRELFIRPYENRVRIEELRAQGEPGSRRRERE